MSTQSADEFVEAVYGHAAALMNEGRPIADIKNALLEQGVDPHESETVIDNLVTIGNEQRAKEGQRNMRIGALWCLGGTAVTALTYAAAADGGTYVLAWGAVVFGAAQFLVGMYQYSTSR